MKDLLSLHRLFVMIVFLGLFAMAMRPVTDPDIWWHLKTGELIATTHQVPHTDPFSFTRSGDPWVNHEWLSDWLIFTLYKNVGMGGLDVAFALTLTAALFLVFLRSQGRPFVAGLFTVFGAFASATSWGVRPQILSLLLASIFLRILERTEKNSRAAWWMLPIMLLWVNLHAGYVLGIVLIVVFMAGRVIETVVGGISWNLVKTEVRTLGLVAVCCCAVVPLNPNGVKLYSYPFVTLKSGAMQAYIAEWFSPNFHEAKFVPFLLMLLALVMFMGISQKRIQFPQLLLLMVTAWMALQSARHIPIFVLVAVPVLSELVTPVFTSRVIHKPSRPLNLRALNYVVLAALLTFTAARTRTVIDSLPSDEAENFPADAVRLLKHNHLPGPLLNHYNWGGYLIWKLYPDYRVFIDGRADVYGEAFMNRFADLYYVKKSDWYATLQEDRIQTVIMPPEAPLVTALLLKREWSQAYSDSRVVILVREPEPSTGTLPSRP